MYAMVSMKAGLTIYYTVIFVVVLIYFHQYDVSHVSIIDALVEFKLRCYVSEKWNGNSSVLSNVRMVQFHQSVANDCCYTFYVAKSKDNVRSTTKQNLFMAN